MTLPPKDYIAARRAEISKKYEELKQELHLLNQMESALEKATGRLDAPPEVDKRGYRRLRPGTTIKELALEALKERGPLFAGRILEAINSAYGSDVDRTSLSPQLSRLKGDGMIEVGEEGYEITEKGLDYLVGKN